MNKRVAKAFTWMFISNKIIFFLKKKAHQKLYIKLILFIMHNFQQMKILCL